MGIRQWINKTAAAARLRAEAYRDNPPGPFGVTRGARRVHVFNPPQADGLYWPGPSGVTHELSGEADEAEPARHPDGCDLGMIDDLGQCPHLPPSRESVEGGAEPLDALGPDLTAHQADEQWWPEPGETCTDPGHEHERVSDDAFRSGPAALSASARVDMAWTDFWARYREQQGARDGELTDVEAEMVPGGPLHGADAAAIERATGMRCPEPGPDGGSWPGYQDMTPDERIEYLGDRAAEMEGGSTEVHDRMGGDGVPASDRARAAETAMSWTTAAAESEAEAAAEDPENAGPAALNAPPASSWDEPLPPGALFPEPEARAGDGFMAAPVDDGSAAELEAAVRYDPADYPLTDAELAAEAEIDDAVAEADHAPGATLGGQDERVSPPPPGWHPPLDTDWAADAAGRPYSTYSAHPELQHRRADAEAEEDPAGPVPYELTERGGYQAVADQMTAREVGPGYLDAEAEAGQ